MEIAHALIQEVLEVLRQKTWPASDLFSVELSLEEAFANAVHHGNRDDKSKKVRFFCEISDSLFKASIEDEGLGFDPNTVRDPRSPENIEEISGRGVLLISSFMDHVDYFNQGRCVVMEKNRSPDKPENP